MRKENTTNGWYSVESHAYNYWLQCIADNGNARSFTGGELSALYNLMHEAGADMDQEGAAVEQEDWDEWDKTWTIINEEMAGRFMVEHTQHGDK